METEIIKITNMIIEEAKKKAELIIQEAQREGDSFVEAKRLQAKQTAEEESSRLFRRLEDAKLVRERVIADAKLKANWKILEEKQKLVDDALEGLKAELMDYTKSTGYESMLKELIATAGNVLQGGDLVAVLNDEDVSKVNLDEISKRISSETGLYTKLSLSEKKHKDYGAIVKTVDEKVIVDNLLSSIIGRMDKELRQKAAKIIFS